MSTWIVTLCIVVVVLAALAIAVQGRGQRKAELLESQLTALRQEMQSLLASQAQGFASQIGQLSQTVIQHLGQMNQTVQKGVENSVQLTSRAQETWSSEVKSSREVLGRIQQQLGEVQVANRELSVASQTLQTVLGGAKTRGSLGEIALERLLSDCLPVANFELQYRFSTGEVVDAVIRFQDKVLSIDSKFLWTITANSRQAGKKLAGDSGRQCEDTRIPYPRNTFCRKKELWTLLSCSSLPKASTMSC